MRRNFNVEIWEEDVIGRGNQMASSKMFGCFAIVSCLWLAPRPGLAQETDPPVKVTYAVMMEGKEPFFAEVSCRQDSICSLARHDDPDIDLSIRVHAGSKAFAELRIYCGSDPCSFDNSRSSIDLSGRRAMLDIFAGEDVSILIPLVARSRPRIGEVLISY